MAIDANDPINLSRDIYLDVPKMFLITSENMPAMPDADLNRADFESLEKPVSLRYLVARLNELFGAYETESPVALSV